MMYAVICTSFGECDCGYDSVMFVTTDEDKADTFVKEQMAKRTSAYAAEYRVEEVEVR